MSKFIIQGQKKLSGEIKVAGNKNAALPIIAATILTDDECILKNVPEIRDVHAMFDIARNIGKTITKLAENEYSVRGGVLTSKPETELVQKLRASILFFGALIARTGEAVIAPPGGCIIGRRQVAPHFEALTDLGVVIDTDEGAYRGKKVSSPQKAYTFLKEASVTATENSLLVAAANPGLTIIENAACEPHVADLAAVLIKMGVTISGIGSNRMEIKGSSKLKGFNHSVSSDFIESGTFAVLAAATKSSLLISGIERVHMNMTGYFLQRMGIGIEYNTSGTSMKISAGDIKSPGRKIQVGLWPGFPTDLMSPMIVLATQATGTTLCHDWMFESRMFFVDKLISMGADITLCDPHRALVTGPARLRGQKLSSPDIRAGIALVIAALTARGESIIDNAELVDRGYQNIVERLQNIGADIKRIE
jgi:UDP-N-acetylglucosamine 1-carboxyvinyltransferase